MSQPTPRYASTTTLLGKERRLRRIFDGVSGKALIVPLDDALISGPVDGLRDPRPLSAQIRTSRVNAVIAFPGTLRAEKDNLERVGWIINLTASTTRVNHTQKYLVGSVEQAIRASADAVAVHVNLTDEHEGEMLHNLGLIIREAELYQLPVVAIMYPRRAGPSGDNNYDSLREADPKAYTALIAHACRVGVDLGADVIKTQYSGSPNTFRTIIEAASKIPVVVAGGPAVDRALAIKRAKDAIRAGAAGLSFGRNVYQRTDIGEFLDMLSHIVHGAQPNS